MSALDRAVNQLRADLLQRDEQAGTEMLRAYGQVFNTVQVRLDRLMKQMEEARGRGETISQGWLLRQQRLQSLQEQAQSEMNHFAEFAERSVIEQQRRAVQQAQSDAQQLALAGLLDAEQPMVSLVWNHIPTEAVTELVGVLQDGSPVRILLDGFGKQASEGIRAALITGLATGQGAREIARQVRRAMDFGLTRALTISRTETLRAYRSASVRSYQANSDVVRSWRWVASLSGRTCPACLAMHGTQHSLTEPFGSHVNCRCMVVPVIQGAREIETGEDWFARQKPETQQRILGVKGAEAYRAGRVILQDFLIVDHSDRWGTTRSARNLWDAERVGRIRKDKSALKTTPDHQKMLEITQKVNVAVGRLTGLPSRWKGRVTIDNDPTYWGVKKWSCTIGYNQETVATFNRFSTSIHEVLHAHSAGLTEPDYIAFKGFEEGVIEKTTRLLRDEVMQEFGHEPGELDFSSIDAQNAYNGYIADLELLRQTTRLSEQEFYLGLLKTSLADREEKIIGWMQEGLGIERDEALRVTSLTRRKLKR